MTNRNDAELRDVLITMIDDVEFEFEGVSMTVEDVRVQMQQDVFEIEEDGTVYFIPKEQIKMVSVDK